MVLEDLIVEKVERKIKEVIGQDHLVALAFTGSRAGSYHNDNSDYDYFAIFDLDIPFHYLDFNLDEAEISVKIEGKSRFEKNIKGRLNLLTEQGSFLWLPYRPLLGNYYLNTIENEARLNLLDHFIEDLPYNQPIRVKPERITEWPLIKQALIWPSSVNRLKAISSSEANPLDELIPKYIEALRKKGYVLSDDNQYIFRNTKKKIEPGNTFSRKLIADTHRFFRKKEDLFWKHYLMGSFFVILQLPEMVCNQFYVFPKYEKNGEILDYKGPTLSEFTNSRCYLNPFRNQLRKIKKNILSIQ